MFMRMRPRWVSGGENGFTIGHHLPFKILI
jgi:hypothetical protein